MAESVPAVVAGLIPAHAGKTMRSRCLPRQCTAHPRSRGENGHIGPMDRAHGGSSPLTRGKPGHGPRGPLPDRLIPAHAGKTGFGDPACYGCWAHPRSRGENGATTGQQVLHVGSSPLTRGKHLQSSQLHRRPGLIPAHAGKTCVRVEDRSERGAHPRSRGENGSDLRRSVAGSGSSPLTRGKRYHPDDMYAAYRLIPAHAGKT